MMPLKILMYEDTADYKFSFEFNLKPKLAAIGVKLDILHRIDENTVMQDIEFLPHIILVDYDLGGSTGIDVLNLLDGDAQMKNSSIVLYSGGESLESLKKKIQDFPYSISCYTKQDDDNRLENFVLSKGRYLKDKASDL